jgi:hypothetical protein
LIPVDPLGMPGIKHFGGIFRSPQAGSVRGGDGSLDGLKGSVAEHGIGRDEGTGGAHNVEDGHEPNIAMFLK